MKRLVRSVFGKRNREKSGSRGVEILYTGGKMCYNRGVKTKRRVKEYVEADT